MATAKAYDPTAQTPYEAPVLPDPTPAAPSPISSQAPQANGAVRTSGAIATMADGVLRGIMAGRAFGQAKQVMQLKKKTDDLQASYNADAKRLYDLHSAGVDDKSPEYQQAMSAVNGSWGSLMQFYGQHIADDKKGKKGGSKGQDNGPSIMERLHSKDPMEQSKAWYEIQVKTGPPIKYQLAQMNTEGAKAKRAAVASAAEAATNLAKAKADYYDLGQKTDRTVEEDDRYKQLGDMLASAATTGKAGPTIRAVAGDHVTGANLPKGAKDAEGRSLAEVPADSTWKSMIRGNEVFYIPMNPNQQLKVTAQPGTGLPEQANYNPLTAHLDVAHPQGMAPRKAEVKITDGIDDAGNHIKKSRQFTPGYTPPAPLPNQPVAPSPVTVLQRRDGTPEPANQSEGITPHQEDLLVPRGRNRAAEHTAATDGNPSATYTVHGKTPEQKEADKALTRQINANHREAGGAQPSGATWDAYSADNQKAFRAIQSLDLTLNGKANSKTDIGLRKATDRVMVSSDPDLQRNVATAMNALDSYSKQSLSTHGTDEYGFIPYWRSQYSTIPALKEAFGNLDKSPEGKVYLDNFFRAWTNAASVRALQGTSGKPTQSMYAMLVNELPMVGVNIHTKQDADRKMDMLQDDVDTAAGTLPSRLQKNLKKGSNRSSQNSAKFTVVDPKGNSHPFDTKEQADEFKKLAGIK